MLKIWNQAASFDPFFNKTIQGWVQTNLELDRVEFASTARTLRSKQSIHDTTCTIPSSPPPSPFLASNSLNYNHKNK
jgi:hypothetical protein